MFHRLFAMFGRLNRNFQAFNKIFLADKIIDLCRAQTQAVNLVFFRFLRKDNSFNFFHEIYWAVSSFCSCWSEGTILSVFLKISISPKTSFWTALISLRRINSRIARNVTIISILFLALENNFLSVSWAWSSNRCRMS